MVTPSKVFQVSEDDLLLHILDPSDALFSLDQWFSNFIQSGRTFNITNNSELTI